MKKILFIILLLPLLVFGQKDVLIHLTTDNYPSETRWILYADSFGPNSGWAVNLSQSTSLLTSAYAGYLDLNLSKNSPLVIKIILVGLNLPG